MDQVYCMPYVEYKHINTLLRGFFYRKPTSIQNTVLTLKCYQRMTLFTHIYQVWCIKSADHNHINTGTVIDIDNQ